MKYKATDKQKQFLLDNCEVNKKYLNTLSKKEASELIGAVLYDKRTKSREYESELVPFDESFY